MKFLVIFGLFSFSALQISNAESEAINLDPNAPDCPPPGPFPEFFPHPTRCDYYYMCSNGVPVLMNCAPTLWWSQQDRTCLPAGSVPCSALSTTSTTYTTTTTPQLPTEPEAPESTTTQKPEEEPTTEPLTEPEQPSTTEHNLFPCPPDQFIYLPHYQFCRLFYLCTQGEYRGTFNCGSTHWFDFRSQRCVVPRESDCTLEPQP